MKVKNLRFVSYVISLILEEIERTISVGMSGVDLELIAVNLMRKNKVKSSLINYGGFPSNICVSVNSELTHGIPNSLPFNNGDIVSIDIACNYHGIHADAARTFLVVDKNNDEDFSDREELIAVTENSLKFAINSLIPGKTTNKDLGLMIQRYVENLGYFVIKEYGGHGIGKNLHEDPFIPNCFIESLEEFTINPGMAICIEPLVQAGNDEIVSNGFVISSKNGELNAHFEHTILVLKKGVEVLV